MDREYLLITSFSLSAQRYVKIWIYQMVETTATDSKSIETIKKLKFYFQKSYSLNSASFKTVIHRRYKLTDATDTIHIYSVDCYSGRVCVLKRDGLLKKSMNNYHQENHEYVPSERPITFQVKITKQNSQQKSIFPLKLNFPTKKNTNISPPQISNLP